MSEFIIDCDATPFIPEGWEIRPEDQLPGAVGGRIEFDPTKIAFHLGEGQLHAGKTGIALAKELSVKPLLKANVLDYLLANAELIPEKWRWVYRGKPRFPVFWGTLYRDPKANLVVRYLEGGGGEWISRSQSLERIFGNLEPAVILVP